MAWGRLQRPILTAIQGAVACRIAFRTCLISAITSSGETPSARELPPTNNKTVSIVNIDCTPRGLHNHMRRWRGFAPGMQTMLTPQMLLTFFSMLLPSHKCFLKQKKETIIIHTLINIHDIFFLSLPPNLSSFLWGVYFWSIWIKIFTFPTD